MTTSLFNPIISLFLYFLFFSVSVHHLIVFYFLNNPSGAIFNGFTVPHPGEPHLTSGLTLLKNSGDPIFTLSPSLTINFG